MLNYIANRILLTIPTLIGVAVVVFFALRIIPGDIVEVKMRGDDGNVSQKTIDAERHRLGLDKPLVEQFYDWTSGLMKLDLGKSMWSDRPVIDEIADRFQVTLQLAIMSIVIGILVALPLGTLSALYNGTFIDQGIRLLTMLGLAVPNFWLAMLIMLALLSTFNWLPPATFTPIYIDPVANLSQLIWPALATGYRSSAQIARLLRSSLLEVLSEDYIRTARAKGVFERLVVRRHALRNALMPVIALIGLEFAFLLGGLVVIEQVFNLNGIGKLLIQAVSSNDFILIQGIVMMVALFYMLVNLIVDLLSAALDPRIRSS